MYQKLFRVVRRNSPEHTLMREKRKESSLSLSLSLSLGLLKSTREVYWHGSSALPPLTFAAAAAFQRSQTYLRKRKKRNVQYSSSSPFFAWRTIRNFRGKKKPTREKRVAERGRRKRDSLSEERGRSRNNQSGKWKFKRISARVRRLIRKMVIDEVVAHHSGLSLLLSLSLSLSLSFFLSLCDFKLTRQCFASARAFVSLKMATLHFLSLLEKKPEFYFINIFLWRRRLSAILSRSSRCRGMEWNKSVVIRRTRR